MQPSYTRKKFIHHENTFNVLIYIQLVLNQKVMISWQYNNEFVLISMIL